jgi:alkylresorcinol/alkylpyrone synthase
LGGSGGDLKMASILSVATALPPHRLDARTALGELRRVWPRLDRLAPEEAALGTRYTCEPVESVLTPRGLDATQAAYLDHARSLAVTAATGALEHALVDGSQIDLIVTVSCTGYLVPSLDVHLAPVLGLRADVLRLPITELGCSGGASALAFADRHVRAFPDHRVLVVAVETPSLNFQPGDGSLDNLTASLVFGDGAGAAVLGTAPDGSGGLEVRRTASRLVPGTAGLLGFDLRAGGFHVVLDRRLQRIVECELRPAVEGFLGDTALRDLDFIAAHAAGPRIFEAIERALELPDDALRLSREVFMAVGNTSSAAIFFTLERLLRNLGPDAKHGIGLGLGPGVSVELIDLEWVPSEHARDEARLARERAPIGGRRVEETLLVPDAIEEYRGVQS